MSEAPIVCVDFDGVLNEFDGWRGAAYLHPPRQGVAGFLSRLNGLGYRVVVFTVRWAPDVTAWLNEYGLIKYISEVTDRKPPAHVYVDDRAICFTGDFDETVEAITHFRAHWESIPPDRHSL